MYLHMCTYIHTYICMYAIHMCTFVHTCVLQCICICKVVLYVRNCMNVQYVLSYMRCVSKYFPSEMGYSVEFSPLWECVHHPMFLPCTCFCVWHSHKQYSILARQETQSNGVTLLLPYYSAHGVVMVVQKGKLDYKVNTVEGAL